LKTAQYVSRTHDPVSGHPGGVTRRPSRTAIDESPRVAIPGDIPVALRDNAGRAAGKRSRAIRMRYADVRRDQRGAVDNHRHGY
jgi:hypothetical protein